MNRRTLFLLIALAISMVFAGWQWFRPYEWFPDAGARYRMQFASVREDHGFCWVDLQLKRHGEVEHDLLKPVALVTAAGKEIQPSEFQSGGDDDQHMATLGFRFWVESSDLAGPLNLRLNDGVLHVRTGSGAPPADGEAHYYYSSRW